MKLESNRLIIRRFELGDQQDIFELLSDQQTCYDIGGYEPFKEMDDEFLKLMQNFLQDAGRYVMVLKENNKVIGSLHLMEEDRAVVCYEIGYSIQKNYRRCGYGFEGISCFMAYCFETLGAKMITASVVEGNEKSISLLEKLGFKYEGMTYKGIHHCQKGPVNLLDYYIEV